MPATAWIELNDFSPGIYSDIQSNGTNQTGIIKDGAATVDNTYRFCADAAGQLIPLPAKALQAATGVTYPDSAHAANTLYRPSSAPNVYLLDGICGYPSTNTAFLVTSTSIGEVGDHLLYAQFYSNAGTGTYVPYITYIKNNNGGINSGQFGIVKETTGYNFNPNSNDAPYLPGGMLARLLCANSAETVPVGADKPTTRIAGIWGFQTSASSTGAIPAADITAGFGNAASATLGNTFMTNSGASPSGVFMFPLQDLITTAASEGLTSGSTPPGSSGTTARLQWIIPHQGRMVCAGYLPAGFGDRASTLQDFIFYTAPNKIFSNSATGAFQSATRALYVEENQSGFGAVASINSSELLIIKNAGGAVLVRGDLDNPTVIRLPNVQSTYTANTAGVNSPIGFVYGSNNGIYAWAGKDTSTCISSHLNPDFWLNGGTGNALGFQALGIRGRLTYWDPFVVCPNDYVYDTTSGAWWRLDSFTIPNNHFDISPTSNLLYSFPAWFTSATAGQYYTYNANTLATSYSWQSQPLATSTQKYLEIDEIELIAFPATGTALSTVVITLTGIDENGNQVFSAPTPFSLTNSTGKMQILHEKVRRQAGTGQFRARYLQMTIAANSNASQAAPKIHSVRIGYQEVQTSQTVNR